MDSTRLFTCIQEGVLADALYEDGKLMELSLHPLEHASILGNIYIGKVRNIVKNIQAAFVEIENGMLCYLPLEDAQAPVYTKPKKEGQPLVQGDELLVQVSREAVKTKQPSVTTKISMNGKYLVLHNRKWKAWLFRKAVRGGEDKTSSVGTGTETSRRSGHDHPNQCIRCCRRRSE